MTRPGHGTTPPFKRCSYKTYFQQQTLLYADILVVKPKLETFLIGLIGSEMLSYIWQKITIRVNKTINACYSKLSHYLHAILLNARQQLDAVLILKCNALKVFQTVRFCTHCRCRHYIRKEVGLTHLIVFEHQVLSHQVGQLLLKLGDLVHKLLLALRLQHVRLLRLLGVHVTIGIFCDFQQFSGKN